MPWIERQHSKGEIDRAGLALITLPFDHPDRERAVSVVDNWRSCHSYPLQIIKMTLLRRAKEIDPMAIISQRLKRRPSIEIKLLDNPTMHLSQMQDIGGCRAVLHDVKAVRNLAYKYREHHIKSAKKRKDRPFWDGSEDFDYIKHPKPDGYRSLHLIFRYLSLSEEREVFNGQRIEIQIRSKFQHMWATAVETAQIFTGQALKSKTKHASDDWLRFFSLMSSAFARREKCPLVPGTPEDRNELVRELRSIVGRENIIRGLEGWNNTIHLLEDDPKTGAYAFLLVLDPKKRSLRVHSFARRHIEEAQLAYEQAEKQNESDSNIQVVLVAVDDLAALRKAYPNYYVDTRDFIKAIQKEIG